MELLKRQLFFLICGVAGVAGIALGVTGMAKLKTVKAQMDQSVKAYSELTALRSGAANQKFIDAEQERIQKRMQNFGQLLAQAKELHPYKPLMENFFPAPPEDVDEREARLEFRRSYQEAFARMVAVLNAGRAATLAEVQQAAEAIALEKKQQKSTNVGPDASPEEPAYTEAGVLTKAGARDDPNARANLEKAQTLYCYMEPWDAENASLEFHPKLREKDRLKSDFTLGDCWDAQLRMWIQQDVIDAIARVNKQAAEELIAKGQSPWVGVLPVKDIISLRVSQDFIGMTEAKPSQAGPELGQPQGWAPAKVPATPEVSFTGSVSEAGSPLDVLQFTLKVVVDQRDLPKLIREISANRFHTLLRCAYVAVPPDPSMSGKIYGAEPVIKAVLDFETHLLADEFRRLMPDETLEIYGYERPGTDERKAADKG